jgi:non-ribosomal peptide synthase protein (TIGR01720 family)
MIPGLFVVLDELPLTPNGKIDRRALPSLVTMEIDREREYIAPQTEEEQILADIWRQLLGVEQISIQDNFFDLGGDSIMVIQMISRANQAGIQITPRQLFQSPTILDLIAVAGEDRAEITAEQGLVTGEVPLTPIQHWFFEQQPINPAHWNTSMFLELFTDLDVDLLRQTIKHLLWHHDALRMRFSIHEGKWQQKGTIIRDEGVVSIINLSDVTARKRKQAIESAAAEMQSSLNLSNGPLIRVAYFDLGEGVNNRLLLIIHHLAFDGVSWRILIEDFQTIYQQLMIGSQVSLQPKSTSYKYWSERLAEYDHSQTIRNEYSQWIQLVGEENEALTMDNPGGENIFGSMQNETMALSTKDTELLVHGAPKVLQSSISDILLTALVKAFVPRTGKRKLLVELAGHGRGHYFDDVDVSRTIGWFSNNYPVLLNLEGVTGLEQEISAIRDQMSRIPNDGIGFGLLRYLSIDDDIQSKMMSLPEPMVYFNYLGQFDQMPSGEWVPFRIADESPGPEQDARSIRSSLLHGVGIISGGELQIRWVYSKNLFKRSTIRKFAADYMKELRKIAKVISNNSP